MKFEILGLVKDPMQTMTPTATRVWSKTINYKHVNNTLDACVLDQCFITKNENNFTKFHTWKLFLHGSCKKGLHYSPSKFGN